jgi:putative glutamine amidotransferase
MRPLIGVFTSERHPGALATLQREGAPAAELRLGTPYLRAVERAGGLPVVLAPHDAVEAEHLIGRLDGLCLAGGPDIDPAAYGASHRDERLGETDRGVDVVELALAQAADGSGTPILGICRGAQAINVLRGGTLHQHVEGHRQTTPATAAAHRVTIATESGLCNVTGAHGLSVNSFHHQAVDGVGAGLRPVSTAPDCAIEAIEDPGLPFVLGVQWHAEGMIERPEQLALFAALVQAAAAPRLALAG